MIVSILLLLLSPFLLLQPWSTVASPGDVLAPILSPIIGDVCKEVKCGQGICKASDNGTIPFVCECSPGWKQLATSDDGGDQGWKFLPCVIPNCTLNYSCSKAPPPSQEKEKQGNGSIFDACQWTDCGGGKCVTTSLFTHKCECSEGYSNLLNLTFSPCLKECSLGSDCKDLYIGFMDKPSPPPSLSADRSNQGDVCKEVKCGQGICKASDNGTIPFVCECSPGWKQLATSDDGGDQGWKFLPCVIPNCTLNYSCLNALPPSQEKEKQGNGSIFDACRWTDCGGGKCVTTSLFTHKCECSEGYSNLLNLTFSPCLKECSLGSDCKDLNIGFMDKPSPPPSLSADLSNQANYRLKGSYDWLIFTITLMAI